MLKTKLRFKPEVESIDPVAQAIIDAAKRTDASNKALIDAVKSIIIAPPKAQIVEQKQEVEKPRVIPAFPAAPIPQRRVFGVSMNAQGFLAQLSTDGQTFTVQRNGKQQITQVSSDKWAFTLGRNKQGLLTEIIAEPL